MSDDGTSAYAWPAGERLARVFEQVVDCAGLRVCDLGCGRGALGLRALAAGARHVSFADASAAALDLVRAQVTTAHGSARAAFHQHLWGTAVPGAPYDLILGGDILYRPECFVDLIATIAASVDGQGRCVLSDPRTRLDDELPRLAAERGLSWSPRRHGDLTVITLAILNPVYRA